MFSTDAATTTLSREQMETHLTLLGWKPMLLGQGGANRTFDGVHCVVYITITNELSVTYGSKPRAYALSTIAAAGVWPQRDDLFARIARKCCEISTGELNV